MKKKKLTKTKCKKLPSIACKAPNNTHDANVQNFKHCLLLIVKSPTSTLEKP